MWFGQVDVFSCIHTFTLLLLWVKVLYDVRDLWPLHASTELKETLALRNGKHSDDCALWDRQSGAFFTLLYGKQQIFFPINLNSVCISSLPALRHWRVWWLRRWTWELPEDCHEPGSSSLCSEMTKRWTEIKRVTPHWYHLHVSSYRMFIYWALFDKELNYIISRN